jgi:hypothetical protein
MSKTNPHLPTRLATARDRIEQAVVRVEAAVAGMPAAGSAPRTRICQRDLPRSREKKAGAGPIRFTSGRPSWAMRSRSWRCSRSASARAWSLLAWL